MKITFTEYTENDSEYRSDEDYRFAGFVTVKAESLADTKRIVDYFKLSNGDNPEQLIKRAELLQNPELEYSHRPKKRPYFEVSGALDVSLFEPYKAWAERVFGYEDGFPDLQLGFKWAGLRHTYLGVDMQTELGETVTYTICTECGPWNKKTGQDYACSLAERYIAEEFGHNAPVQEFIPTERGQYKRNPQYGTGFRNPVTPRLVNENLCNLFAQWWLENVANSSQLEILQRNSDLVEKFGKHCAVNWVKDYSGFHILDSNGNIDFDGNGTKTRLIKFEEFATA